jgi:hypothetical protein
VELFEGEPVPVATPEKALLDWCWLAEELGLDPRLDEMEWSALDLGRLDGLAASHHDQARLRGETLARLR